MNLFGKILRRALRHDFYCKNSYEFYNNAYKAKIYTPYYNMDARVSSLKPEIYNKSGQKMDVWFIRDKHIAHNPYAEPSKYFLWDRFDIGLDTHFYSHEAMLQTMGNPSRRYGIFIESEFIVPESYKIFKKHPGLYKDFDSVFTYSEQLLDTVPNAKFYASCASVWYGAEPGSRGGALLSDTACDRKTKSISMVCSNKRDSRFHRIRQQFAAAAVASGKVDLFGTFNNGSYLNFKSDSLTDYRF